MSEAKIKTALGRGGGMIVFTGQLLYITFILVVIINLIRKQETSGSFAMRDAIPSQKDGVTSPRRNWIPSNSRAQWSERHLLKNP